MKWLIFNSTLVLVLATNVANSQPTEPVVVLEGLRNPCGVAVQESTGTIFVSESGNGRIIRVADGRAEDVIVGFSKDSHGDGPTYTFGPLGLAFQGENRLVVGGGGLADGSELIRVYDISDVGEKPKDANNTKFQLGPLPKTSELAGEGDFYSIAAAESAIIATSNGDDDHGWIVRANARGASGYGSLRRFIPTKETVGVDAPTAIAISPRMEIVVGHMGEIDQPNDSRISFYHAKTGDLLASYQTGLHDVTAIAYSKMGRLYALDFSWRDPAQGGLFRFDAASNRGRLSVNAVKIVPLDQPTAMAFGKDGALYVTVFGGNEQSDGSDDAGQLLRIPPPRDSF